MNTTHIIDARALVPGSTFFRRDNCIRRVLRTRQVAPGLTEIMHGQQHTSGFLEYTNFAHGHLVLVPMEAPP